MPGKLDEISRAIGDSEASIRGLKETFDRHCIDDDRRHEENIATMRGIGQEIGELRRVLEPLAQSVSFMRPIVDGYQSVRSKLALMATIGIAAVVLLGWVVEAGVKWIVTVLLAKFGG